MHWESHGSRRNTSFYRIAIQICSVSQRPVCVLCLESLGFQVFQRLETEETESAEGRR